VITWPKAKKGDAMKVFDRNSGLPPPQRAGFIRHGLAVLCLIASTALASAHPHVFVETTARVIFDDQGRIAAIHNVWTFDESYSVFVTQGMTSDGGVATVEQLRPIAETNIDQLAAFAWFNFVKGDEGSVDFSTPKEFSLMQRSDHRLVLSFVLPLKQPIRVSNSVVIEVFDPTYYVAFDVATTDPVTMTNAPSGCSVAVLAANPLDASETETVLAAKKRDVALNASFAARLTGQVRISCG
jgi:ABC-type uncharacterized transport system substrate-binding protein